jgi:hypothetical protein
MAEEKPRDNKSILRDYFNRGAKTTSGAGTKELTDDPELAELLKLLREKGVPIKSPEELAELLKALGMKLPETRETAQKRAAETNQVDQSLADQWFRDHWKNRNCAICQEVTWSMAPDFAHIPMNLIWRHSPVRTFPCVVLTCRACGNTVFFNANAMKLLPEGSE